MNPSLSSATLSAPTPASTEPVGPAAGQSAAQAAGEGGGTRNSAPGLGTELRESLLLLVFAVATTVGLTAAAQAALAALG